MNSIKALLTIVSLHIITLAVIKASVPIIWEPSVEEETEKMSIESRFCKDDFIRASLLIASPNEVLYSCIGHAFFRMECPCYGLDYCFSYESEGETNRLGRFLAGNLKMGMMAIPTEIFLEQYKATDRSVTSYQLQLTTKQEQLLWEKLDNKVEEGINLRYDYMERGCAQSCLRILEEALVPGSQISFHSWPDYFEMTRRELVSRQMDEYPWNALALYILVGSEADENVSPKEKVVTPSDLIYVLQNTTIDGRNILGDEVELLKGDSQNTGAFSPNPFLCSIVLLTLTLLGVWRNWRFLEYVLLVLQCSVGLFLCYLIFFSSLPCTQWNWLIIPFNPLPLIFWKWVRWWAIPYSAVLLIWLLAVLLYPHIITDTTFLVIAFSLFIIFINRFIKSQKNL